MAALPQTVGFQTADLGFDWPHAVDEAPSGGTQTAETAAHRWTFTARWPRLSRDEWAPIMAFIAARRSAGESFTVIPPQLATPRGALGGTPLVNAPDVVNGGFDADTDWTKEAGWSIAAGVATRTATGSITLIYQPVALMAGVTYEITHTVSAITAGTIGIWFTGGTIVAGPARSAPGVYTETMTAVAGNANLALAGNDAFEGSIDDVSIALAPGGSVLPVDGASTGITNWVRAGDVLKVDGHAKVYMATADADSDGSGNVVIPVVPPFFAAPVDDEAVTLTDVPFTMGMVGSVQSFPVEAPLLMTRELDLRERP